MSPRRSPGRRLSATQLAELGICERQTLYKHRGRTGQAGATTRQAKQRGEVEHERRYKELTRPTPTLAPAGGPGDRRCFIATAIYGPDAWQTNALRSWRDTCLLPHGLGRALTRTYYCVSPALVRLMHYCPWLARLIRRPLDGWVKRIKPIHDSEGS